MAYNLICRRLKVYSFLKSTLRHKTHTEKTVSSREFCSTFSNRYNEDKYSEIRSRLTATPCVDMLNKEIERFRHDLCNEKDDRLKDLLKWFSKVFEHNISNGGLFVGINLLKAYCTYGFSITDTTWNHWDSEGWRSAILLALGIEMTTASFSMLDDIIDQSSLRANKMCWYKKPGVGLTAIHDCMVLVSTSLKHLENHFSNSKCYTNILQEFIQVNLLTSYGQCMDGMYAKSDEKKFDNFTLERYETLAHLTVGRGLCVWPVFLAMHLAGGYYAKDFDFSEKLCRKLGLYIKSKADFSDYLFASKNKGLNTNDISRGNLTWCAVKFFEVATESMKKEFVEYYGVDDQQAISKILHLYKEINMLDRFQELEEKIFLEISALIESKDDIKGAFYFDMFQETQKIKPAYQIQ